MPLWSRPGFGSERVVPGARVLPGVRATVPVRAAAGGYDAQVAGIEQRHRADAVSWYDSHGA